MAPAALTTSFGGLELRSPLIAASGTVGSVWEWAEVADTSYYGAAVAKSVSPTPWSGQPAPRVAPLAVGMLNGIGIQNPGVEAWMETMRSRLSGTSVPVWGSAVAGEPEGFALVSKGLSSVGVAAIEVNLSCPNLEDDHLFSFNSGASRDVLEAVVASVDIPVGAKLSPNTPDIVDVARNCSEAGASFVVLTNTAFGFGLSLDNRMPLLSTGSGGYSGPGLKPLSLRCVYEVYGALPELPIVGCGGISSGSDVVEYLVAGASAVQLGTINLAEPKAGRRIHAELIAELEVLGETSLDTIVGTVGEW